MLSLLIVLFLGFNTVQAQDWELLWSYDVSADAGVGQAGSETDGEYLYTTFWASGNFAKFDLDGSWIETFTVPGATGLRDLAYDGTYFYASNAAGSGVINQMDFTTQTLITTIPAPAVGARHIAYDSDNDAFWCGNWATDIVRVGRDGSIGATIAAATHGVISIYGSAYDNISEGGPFLWLHSQDHEGSSSAIVQIELETGTQTGIWHDAMLDAGSDVPDGIAGGLFNSLALNPGYFVVGGLIQGTPNKFFAYTMGVAGEPPPLLVFPENNSNLVTTEPLFQWNGVPDALSYQIQVSNVSDFSTTVIDVNEINDVVYQTLANVLEETTVYYWHVRANYAEGVVGAWSKKWTFITEGPLTPPVLVSPFNNETEIFSNAPLDWNSVLGAEWYQVQVSSDAGFEELVYDENNLASTDFVAGGLELNTPYWWRARAHNSAVSSEWSEEWMFTTTAISAVYGYNAYDPSGELGEGPVTFSLDNPGEMILLNDQTGQQFLSGGAWANGVWYATVYGDNNFVSVNTATGERTLVGYTGRAFNGLSYDVTTNTMYASAYEDNVCNLYTIDLTSGAATLIGGSAPTLFINMACDINGELYAVDISSDNFYHIDKMTGVAEVVGPLGYGANYAQSMEFDLINDICYWAGYTATGGLYTIDVETGAATWITDFPGGLEMDGFAIPFETPCLAFPQLVIPENEARGVNVAPEFDWLDVPDALTYSIQIATDKNFENLILNEDGLTSSSYTYTGTLDELSMYWWRIQAWQSEECYSYWSTKWMFITDGELPTPVLITPENGAAGVAPSPQFTWIGHFAATGYHFQLSTTEDFSGIVIDETMLTAPQFTASGLSMNTQYWWRVEMFNPTSTSPWSEIWTFTTGAYIMIGEGTEYNTGYGFPTGYGNWYGGCKQQFIIRADEIYAAGGTPGFLMSLGFNVAVINSGVAYQDYEILLKNTTENEAGATWDMDGLTQVYYNEAYVPVEGWNIHNFTDPFFWDGGSNLLVEVCFNNLTYTYNESCYWTYYDWIPTRYYQRDNTVDVCENPQWTNTSNYRPNMQFSLEVPAILPPYLADPVNNALCVNTAPLFDWLDTEGAISYTLQVATDPDFYNIMIDVPDIPESQYQVPAGSALLELTQFYWRVNATDGENISFWSQRWKFITEGDLSAPILISPLSGSLDLAPAQFLTWEAVFGAVNYQVQVATDADFENLLFDTYANTNQFLAIGLPLTTEIYWRVNSQNECSTSPWSETWNFVTGATPLVYGYAAINSGDYVMGPVTFALDNPGFLIQMADQQDLQFVAAGTWANDVWYGVEYGTYSFITLNTFTGERTVIGNVGFDATGLSWDVQTNTMYCLGYDGANTNLYTIDIATGNATLLGVVMPGILINLAASVDGELYSVSISDENFYLIDKYSAVPTLIGPTGFDANYAQDMEFEKVTNTCYWAGYVDYYGALLTVDIETGQGTIIGQFPGGLEMTGFAIPFTPACLDFPQLAAPANQSLCISTTPEFDWLDVNGALTYSIQIATDRSFENLVYSTDGLTTSDFTLPVANQLDENSLYWWRVMAFGEDGCDSYWSSKWRFVTEGDLPAPITYTPPNGATGYITTPTFEWEGNIAAASYHLQVSSNADFTGIIIDETNLTTTSFTTGGFELTTQYWWRVLMQNECSTSEWSEVSTFTTGSFVNIGTGTSFNANTIYPAPYGNWYGGCKHQILIRADELYDAGAIAGNITSLSFEIAQINVGTLLQDFYIAIKNTTETEISTVWDLVDWTLVYGPVDYQPVLGWNAHQFTDAFAWDGASNILLDICFNNMSYTRNESTYYTPTAYTSVRWFNSDQNATVCTNPTYVSTSVNRPNMMFGLDISGIAPPENLLPENDAMYVSQTPLFDFTDVEGVIGYGLIVATDPTFTNIVINEPALTESQYQVPAGNPLQPLTMYYWKANATDGYETSSWSQRWSFATGGDLPAPYLIVPVNNAASIPSTVPFDWEDVFGAAEYQIQVAIDPAFGNLVVDQTVTPSYLTFGLEMNSQYYWRVRAINPESTSPWSEVWEFTTGNFFVIGDGTAYNDQYNYPAPYGNYWWGAKHQILVLADEILAAGGVAGDLTSLSFNAYALNGAGALVNFEIRMKQTTATSLSAWDEVDLTTVYLNPSLVNTLGWNTHMFINPFEWDGVSNILIDICFNNSSYTRNVSTYYTPTTYNSVLYYRADASTVCTSPGTPTTSVNRPNIMFSGGPGETPLNPPDLISPEDGASNQTLLTQFNWSTVEGGVEYRIQVSSDETFTNIAADIVTPNTTYTMETPLTPETQYWWRARAISESGYGGYWSNVWSFTTRPNLPPEFLEVNTNTGNDADIVVPASIAPMIGDRAMINGDAIGLFYEREPGDWHCAGYGVWTGENFSITVYGDDPNTTLKDGYAVGEPYSFKVWDSMLDIIYWATATFDIGPTAYQVNGFSVLSGLYVQVTTELEISLNQGWNMISSYVSPTDPSIVNIFAPMVSNVQVMKNGYGQMYSPAFGINTIENWNDFDGYLLNVYEDGLLNITGNLITPEITPIPLDAGWNLTSYLRNSQMYAPTALADLGTNLVIVKNNDGHVYFPAWGLNTLGNLNPGEGYYINVAEEADLLYPANSVGKATAGEIITSLPKHLIPSMNRTGSSATLLIQIEAENGTEVGVYNTNGDLIGSGYVQDGVVAANIWGDNSSTNIIDGAVDGEILTAKLYNPTTNSYNSLILSSIVEITQNIDLDAISYSDNAIYAAKGTAFTDDVYGFSIRNNPNPASNTTSFEFSLPSDGNAEIVIYTIRGDEVGRIRLDGYSAGVHSVVFNTDNLTNGSYNVVLRSGSNNVSSIMMIVK